MSLRALSDRALVHVPSLPSGRSAQKIVVDPGIVFVDHPRSLRDVCVFCDVGRGVRDAEIVFENEHCMAFLDTRPLFPGHCLVIPRSHVETLADLPPGLLAPLFAGVQLLSRAVPEALEAHGSFVAMNNKVSQSVAHLHVHVVPRRFKDGLKGFFWPRRGYSDDAHMRAVAGAIRAAIAKEGAA